LANFVHKTWDSKLSLFGTKLFAFKLLNEINSIVIRKIKCFHIALTKQNIKCSFDTYAKLVLIKEEKVAQILNFISQNRKHPKKIP
jgi:hypothetical protein